MDGASVSVWMALGTMVNFEALRTRTPGSWSEVVLMTAPDRALDVTTEADSEEGSEQVPGSAMVAASGVDTDQVPVWGMVAGTATGSAQASGARTEPISGTGPG